MLLWISALCYSIPFFIPTLWPLILFFPPLLLSSLPRATTRTILAWSFVTSALLLFPLCYALIRMAQGPLLLKLIPPLLLISYVAIWMALWLVSIRWILKKTSSLKTVLSVWTVSLWLYLMIMETAFLWPLGRCEGYLLFNPLLPLSYYPALLAPLSVFPLWFVLGWYCVITSSFYARFYQKKALLFTLFFSVPWIIMAARTPKRVSPPWLTTIGHLPLMLPSSICLEHGCMLINHEIEKMRMQNPAVSTIIMPESSWSGSALANRHQLPLAPGVNLVIGSYAHHENSYFNRLYSFKQGILQQQHDKRQAIPLVERNFPGTHFFCDSLFFSGTPATTPSSQARKPINLPFGSMVPYICSELYCNSAPDDPLTLPILAVCNDWWFPFSFQTIMALGARFRAVQWHRAILYISFHEALYFDQSGSAHPISTSPSNRSIELNQLS